MLFQLFLLSQLNYLMMPVQHKEILCATAILAMSFLDSCFPCLTFPAGSVVVDAPLGVAELLWIPVSCMLHYRINIKEIMPSFKRT